MNIIVEINQEFKDWDKYTDLNSVSIERILKAILLRYDNLTKIQNVELSILLTNNSIMQSLNNEFRKQNKPTNVLSFPDNEIIPGQVEKFNTNNEYLYLGDIAFGYEKIMQEATLLHITFTCHFKHLLVHSILHLIGYDHINDKEAKIMQNIEIAILSDFGIKSPY